MRSPSLRKTTVRTRRPARAWLRLDVLECRLTPTLLLPDLSDRPRPMTDPFVYNPSSIPAGFDQFAYPINTATLPDGVPVLTEVSRSADPGQTVAVTGHSLSSFAGTAEGADAEFLVYGQTAAPTLPVNAGLLRIDGPRAAVALPDADDLTPDSMYMLFGRNQFGVGRPLAVGRTEAWWATDGASAGDTVYIHGRNLIHRSQHAAWAYVETADGKAIPGNPWIPMTVDPDNPYRVSFQVPTDRGLASKIDYHIYMHNMHGADYGWSERIPFRLRAPLAVAIDETDGVFTITDPNDVNPPAIAEDGNDDSAAINAAILKASKFSFDHQAEGKRGVVEFTKGTFHLDHTLNIVGLQNVLFRGPAPSPYTPPATLAANKDMLYMVFGDNGIQNVEFRDLTINGNGHVVPEPVSSPTPTMLHLRGAQDLKFDRVRFVSDAPFIIPLDVDFAATDTRRVTLTACDFVSGYHSFFGSAEQVRIDGCHFVGKWSVETFLLFWGGDGVSVTDCTAESYNHKYGGNDLEGSSGGRFVVTQDIFRGNRNIYVADNTTYDLSPHKDAQHKNTGEQILFEGLSGPTFGRPVAGTTTANSVTIAGLDSADLVQEPMIVTVIDGKGLGQRRKFDSFKYDSVTQRGTVVVDPPWAVEPDDTSTVTIAKGLERVAVYRNTLDGDAYWLTHSGSATSGVQIGGVAHVEIASNTITDVLSGVNIWPGQNNFAISADSRPRFDTTYFNVVKDNTITNTLDGVTLTTFNFGYGPGSILDPVGGYATVGYGSAILGTVIRGNMLGNVSRTAVGVASSFDYRAVDLAVIELNTDTLTAAAGSQKGVEFYGNSFGDDLFDVIVRKNDLTLGANSTAVTFSKAVTVGLFDNDWSSAAVTYAGTAITGPVIELPTRVVRMSWGPGGADPADIPVRHAGTPIITQPPLVMVDSNWLSASITSFPTGEVGDGNIQVKLVDSVLGELGWGDYSATVSVIYAGQTQKFTVQVSASAFVSDKVGPYQGKLPNIRRDAVTLIEAEDFNRGKQGVAYYDLTEGNDPGDYRSGVDVDIAELEGFPGRYAVVAAEQEEWLKYSVNVADAGEYRIQFRTRSKDPAAYFRLEDNGVDVTDLVQMDNSGDYVTVEPTVNGNLWNWTTGVHELTLYFRSAQIGTVLGDIDWFRFSPYALTLPFTAIQPAVSVFHGTKIEAEDFDRGGNGIAYFDDTLNNQDSTFRDDEDVDITALIGGGHAVVGSADEWLNYSIDVRHAGFYHFTFAMTGSFGDKFRVETTTGTVSNLSSSTTQPVTIEFGEIGIQTFRIVFETNGSNGNAGKLDWFRVAPCDRTLVAPEMTPAAVTAVSTEIEVGNQVAVNVPGVVTALRFYKTANEGILHCLRLRKANGDILIEENFNTGTAAGWYTVDWFDPVSVEAGLYTISVNIHTEYGTHPASIFAPAAPDVLSFVVSRHGNPGTNPTGYLTHLLGAQYPYPLYAFTDLTFTPDYDS